MIQKYIISLSPITKKNSQQILTNRRTGKPFIAPSRQYKKYEQTAMWYLTPKPKAPLSGRYRVATVFYMPTRRRDAGVLKKGKKPAAHPCLKKTIKPIEQCVREADAMGLTYGQYVARGLDKE